MSDFKKCVIFLTNQKTPSETRDFLTNQIAGNPKHGFSLNQSEASLKSRNSDTI